jgi:phage terminase large subunit-like protein
VSTLTFKTYEMRRERLQSESVDLIWCDEKPDEILYSELLARTSATEKRLIAAWNERQALRAPMIFSLTIGAAIRAGYWFPWVRWQGPCGDLL